MLIFAVGLHDNMDGQLSYEFCRRGFRGKNDFKMLYADFCRGRIICMSSSAPNYFAGGFSGKS